MFSFKLFVLITKVLVIAALFPFVPISSLDRLLVSFSYLNSVALITFVLQ